MSKQKNINPPGPWNCYSTWGNSQGPVRTGSFISSWEGAQSLIREFGGWSTVNLTAKRYLHKTMIITEGWLI